MTTLRKPEEYCTNKYPLAETVRIMMKDFQNMQIYVQRDRQTKEWVP